ncbi:MAG: preprotein translocase subunit SecG [Gammaproteobacteria bacterium]
MFTALLIIDILVSIALIGLILMQHGKGADVGAAFGSGASQTVFGSGGSGSFLTRATAVLALMFFIISLSLAYLTGQRPKTQSVMDGAAPAQTLPQAPVTGLPTTPLAPDVPAPPLNSSVVPKDSSTQIPVEPSGTPIDVPAP